MPYPLVVATCSSGKRVRGEAVAARLARGPQDAVEREWLAMLSAETRLAPAVQVYKGRAFGLTRDAAALCGGRLGILSAGLGYVRDVMPIPGYDLTVRPGGPGSVVERVTGAFSHERWWRSLLDGPFSADLAADLDASSIALVCLSRSYVPLVAPYLEAFEAKRPGRLRLFGLSLGKALPASLAGALMPYDPRLELLGRPGTRSDFAARALADFVAEVLPGGDNGAHAHAEMVRARLATTAGAPAQRALRRVDDNAVRHGIRRLLEAPAAPGVSLLTRFRRETGLSCEQRRFAALARAVRAEARR